MNLSVITPTFNAVRFIEACVANVVAQGSVVLEHIIADGGSTDGTVEVLLQLMQRYPHIKYLPGPDKGQSDALNKAASVARGDAIGILNADDFYEPSAAEEGIRHLALMREPGIVCGDCRVLDEDGKELFLNRPTDLRLNSLLLGWAYVQHPCNPSAYFYHRNVHFVVGGYDVDDHYSMDLDFLLSTVAKVEAVYVPAHWGNFRLMKGGKTHDDNRTTERAKTVVNRHLHRLPLWRRVFIRLLQARIDLVRRVRSTFDSLLRSSHRRPAAG